MVFYEFLYTGIGKSARPTIFAGIAYPFRPVHRSVQSERDLCRPRQPAPNCRSGAVLRCPRTRAADPSMVAILALLHQPVQLPRRRPLEPYPVGCRGAMRRRRVWRPRPALGPDVRRVHECLFAAGDGLRRQPGRDERVQVLLVLVR